MPFFLYFFFFFSFSYRDALALSTRVQLVILSYRAAPQPRSVPVQLIVAGRALRCLQIWGCSPQPIIQAQ